MKKTLGICFLVFGLCAMVVTGCGQQEAVVSEVAEVQETVVKGARGTEARETATLDIVEVAPGTQVAYLTVTAADASSFDLTPDWAPEPNPMSAADGDMLTRWSSDYAEGTQWISFDLGKPSVVNNVILRWERAHATEYKILASLDGKSWKEVYHEKAGTSGTMEASFPAVKCRYIKVLGLTRVNDDWGISIWEAEIYGPQPNNPGAEVTKEAYLSKGEDEDKIKEAEETLAKLAAPVVPLTEKLYQKGVVYTSWMSDELMMPASDLMLAYLKKTGFDTIAIMVPAYQETIESKVIFTNDKPGGDTPTDEALKHAIASCHKLGLRVVLKPHVDPRTDEARINIMPSEEWFDSFQEFTVRYAKLAQETGVEMYCIGTELEATTFSAWAERWNQIIEAVKTEYTGLLTYAANWTEYKEVPFWDKMDFIGLDAYFPLMESGDYSTADLVNSWDGIAGDIEKWLDEKGLKDKGVILTEIGYPSAEGARKQPWVAISKIESQQEQADCLQAMYEALSKRSWFKGYYIWQYFPQDRWSPLGFTVKGKKSEEIIKGWLIENGEDKEEVLQ